jgi:hypothetical protein
MTDVQLHHLVVVCRRINHSLHSNESRTSKEVDHVECFVPPHEDIKVDVRPWHRWHMQVLPDALATCDGWRVPDEAYLGDDLPLHKQPHRCVQAICIPLHVELEVVLRLLPLSNASATPMRRAKTGL